MVKDYRFKNSKGNYWSLRLELIPKRDKKRNTRGFVMAKNESGKEEWYSTFYERIEKMKMTYKSYEEILKVNKDDKWKYNPMRNIRVEGEKSHIPLRFNLTNEQWNEVYKKKSFAGVKITRRIG